MKYKVRGYTTLVCTMVVEANSEEEAIELANDEFGGLKSYAGMGGSECLVGVVNSDMARCIYSDSDVIFDECEEVEE